MSRIAFICLFCLLSVYTASAGEFVGNKLLEILGEDKASASVSKFKTEFSLDKSLKNPDLGIKLTAGHEEGSVITAVTVSAAGYEVNDVKYKQFEGALPFYISLNDDADELEKKFGSKGGDDDTRLRFKKDGITVSIFFKSSAKKKISYIKFTQNVGLVGPYRVGGTHEIPVMLADAVPNTLLLAKNAKTEVKVSNKNVTSLPTAATFARTSSASERLSADPFYNAIMNVIESGEEEMFSNIKKDPIPTTNFWNYKYTYATSVRIPGEKYNLLYSFPFQNSQLDFVSVLEETDGNNPNIQAKYAEVEAKLKEYFKTSEGWSYHYTVNQEDPKGIKDFELKNPKLGSIVLDHSINPYGKHVLYLRFLLQYT